MLLDKDPFHAFLPYPAVEVASAPEGPLAGLRLAVKDLYDVAGYRTGCGNPLKLAASPVAEHHAAAVAALLSAGARFVGKTHTDELAWSLYGVNAHFGTPINPAAPEHIPGGSSSGSAAAVAGGLAEIGLGTDTGGSVRAPASFCGLWGLRPTHGRIPLDGCMPLAPGFDTGGFFTRDGATFETVAAVLLGNDAASGPAAPRFLVPEDMVEGVLSPGRRLIDEALRHLECRNGLLPRISVYDGRRELLYAAFRDLQSAEILSIHGGWFKAARPPLGSGIAERFAYATTVTEPQQEAARALRAAFTAALDHKLGADGVLIAPVVHDAPFRIDAPQAVYDSYRHDAMKLLCVAGHTGLPQVVFPLGRAGPAPFGLSLIGPRGRDRWLVRLAAAVAEQVA